MTDLRAQLEQKIDSLKIEFAEEMQRKLMEFDENQIAMTNWPNVYARGADAMLSLLWPVIEAAEGMKRIYEKTERKDFGKDQQEAWACRTNMFDALTELRQRIGEGK